MVKIVIFPPEKPYSKLETQFSADCDRCPHGIYMYLHLICICRCWGSGDRCPPLELGRQWWASSPTGRPHSHVIIWSRTYFNQLSINYQLNGRSWNLKTFRLSLVRSPATTPQVALPLQTRSAMPTYPGAQYQPQPDASGRPILDLSRNIHWHPIISSPQKSGGVQPLSIFVEVSHP